MSASVDRVRPAAATRRSTGEGERPEQTGGAGHEPRDTGRGGHGDAEEPQREDEEGDRVAGSPAT
jgi:hypothetical protein